MKLIVGLGNPGKEYENTRHNVGFSVLEEFTQQGNIVWGNEAKANALIFRFKIGKEDVVLALPQSYMNLSGEVVVQLLHWFKLGIEDLIIVHDEIDLPFGTVQVRKGIGHAGNNGIRSIIEKLKTEDFIRVRIGIGATSGNISGEKYVLGKFSDNEVRELKDIKLEAVEKIKLLVTHGYEEFMSKYNS